MRTITALFAVLLCPSLFAQAYLPLGIGNYWVYQSEKSSETITISVGYPTILNGKVYYSVKGYGVEPMIVRRTDEGNLVQVDVETGVESTVAIFEPGRQWESPLSECSQLAESTARSGEFVGLAGTFGATLTVNYTPGSCADAGYTEEIYAQNIGLLRRVVNTFAGPVQYDLVAARVGKFTFAVAPTMVVRLSIPENALQRSTAAETLRLQAVLRLDPMQSLRVRVVFPSSQRYEMVLRNQEGEVVYRWSDGKAFTQEMSEEFIFDPKVYEINGEIDAAMAAGLADGFYSVEAWLTTTEGPKFASATGLLLTTWPTI
ncbi:BsuPI-related putative proteinase inhibitor [uncultured Paludibaculum sp.]|uniref:BsuPI-related putative proteinase inhibitor n=1 Tax=uncultured Paludibaculum sp. TaxID=1765020 RepID=UPI002AAAB3C8|nr:BsuPI-related putative proteinase inhibitor [uncultured Paludibaculum sp.]